LAALALAAFVLDIGGLSSVGEADGAAPEDGSTLCFVRREAGLPGSGLRPGFQLETNWENGIGASVSLLPKAAVVGMDGVLQSARQDVAVGWSGYSWFARVGFSNDDSTGVATLDDGLGTGLQGGWLDMNYKRIGAAVGQSLAVSGFEVTPSLRAFEGRVKQSELRSGNAVLTAGVPRFSERYSGVGIGLTMAPTSWLHAGSFRWRPQFSLMSDRLSTDGPTKFRSTHRDRLGVLSFAKAAQTREMPPRILGMSAGVSMVSGETWSLRSGLAAVTAGSEVAYQAVEKPLDQAKWGFGEQAASPIPQSVRHLFAARPRFSRGLAR